VTPVSESVPTQLEDAVLSMVRAARVMDAATPAIGVILLDAARSATTVVKGTLAVRPVRLAARAEDVVILGTTVLRWVVSVDAARTEAPAPALVVVTITTPNAPPMAMCLAPEKTSAARLDTNATATPPMLPNALSRLLLFPQRSPTPTPTLAQTLRW
jgi:hypothetical protein